VGKKLYVGNLSYTMSSSTRAALWRSTKPVRVKNVAAEVVAAAEAVEEAAVVVAATGVAAEVVVAAGAINCPSA
jgi:hypothetical protein